MLGIGPTVVLSTIKAAKRARCSKIRDVCLNLKYCNIINIYFFNSPTDFCSAIINSCRK